MEVYFSKLKRVVSEIVRARKPEYMIQEVGLKVLLQQGKRQ